MFHTCKGKTALVSQCVELTSLWSLFFFFSSITTTLGSATAMLIAGLPAAMRRMQDASISSLILIVLQVILGAPWAQVCCHLSPYIF